MKSKIYRRYGKRLFDLLFSITAIVFLFPLLLVLAGLVRIGIGSPIFFKQPRPGINNSIFIMYKFRTMTNLRSSDGELLPDNVRLTKFGNFLRATSLDELPELFNILLGDMSIVGPRPQLIVDKIFMNDVQNQRHTVLPGLTGLAQVNGRNDISWELKFKYDLEYINNISLKGDLIIILKTFFKVFKKDGINSEGMATAENYGDYLLRTGKISTETYEKTIATK